MGGENEEDNLRMFCLCVTRTDGEVLGSKWRRGEKVGRKEKKIGKIIMCQKKRSSFYQANINFVILIELASVC